MNPFGTIFIFCVFMAFFQAYADRPINMNAFFRSGQVFITWTEVSGADGYVVYSSTSPLTAPNLTQAAKRRNVMQGSSGSRLLAEAHSMDVHPAFALDRYAINPIAVNISGLAQEVPAGTGLTVLTTHTAGTYYYAVTAIDGGIEDKSLDGGNTVGPIVETVHDPEPVLIWQSETMFGRVYLQYLDVDSFNVTLSNAIAFPYFVGVWNDHHTTTDRDELLLFLGGYAGEMGVRDLFDFGRHILVWPHDGAGCWWTGYSQNFTFDTSRINYNLTDIPSSGPVVNYTQARIMNFLKWMIHDEPYYAERIDTNNIMVQGGSMGGGGTLMMCQTYPDFFARGVATVAPTNFFEGEDWTWKRDGESKWGASTDNGCTMKFMGYRSEWARDNFTGMTVHAWWNLENMLVVNRAVDMPYIMSGHGGRDGSVNWPQQGQGYYPKLEAGAHGWAGGLVGAAGHSGAYGMGWHPQEDLIRKNQSFPALRNVAGNPTINLPDLTDLDFHFNKHILWSSSTYRVGGYQNQVDETNRYEIVLASTHGSDTADITPRRLQHFVVQAGQQYIVKNTDVTNTSIIHQIDTVTADSDGLVTFERFQVFSGDANSGGSRLVIQPVVPVSGVEDLISTTQPFTVYLSPNPFNPVITISVGAIGGMAYGTPTKHAIRSSIPAPLRILIYDISGRLITDLSHNVRNGACTWNASGHASGIYVVRVLALEKWITKRVTLVQ